MSQPSNDPRIYYGAGELERVDCEIPPDPNEMYRAMLEPKNSEDDRYNTLMCVEADDQKVVVVERVAKRKHQEENNQVGSGEKRDKYDGAGHLDDSDKSYYGIIFDDNEDGERDQPRGKKSKIQLNLRLI